MFFFPDHIYVGMRDKLSVIDHMLNFKNEWNCTQNLFLIKKKKSGRQVLKNVY